MIQTQRILTALGLLAGLHFAPASATPPYHALVLGIADGRSSVQVANPVDLNRWGQVLGTYGASNAGGTHAVLWTPAVDNDGSGVSATLFPLENSPGFPVGSTSTFPTSLSDRGLVPGFAFTPGAGDGNQRQAWLWRPATLNSTKGVLHGTRGTAVTFPLLQGTTAQSDGQINNKGLIVAAGINGHPALFTPSTQNGLSGVWSVELDHGGSPSGINDAAQFVGGTCSGGAPWNGPYIHKGPLPMQSGDNLTSPLWISPSGPTCVGAATAINAAGDAVINAVSSGANAIDPYLYRKGAVTDLDPGSGGRANAVNKYDQVVGHMGSATSHAALFESGQALDLNTLNDSTNGLVLKDAIAINDLGQILTNATFPGAGAPTLLTPIALVTNPVQVATGATQITGTTYRIAVTVTNLGATTITGPISVALDALTKGVTLTNKIGTTFYAGPGSVYVDVSPSNLAAGATTAPFTLVFSNPGLKTITFTGRVLGTDAPR